MKMPCRSLLALLFLLSSALLAEDEVSEKDFKTALVSTDSTVRFNTWKRLNPEKDGQYRQLVQILRALPWYDREGAIFALAKAATDETLKKMAKDLKDNKDPAVRQGMAEALAKMNDEKFYAYLYEALKDKDATVRRMVVHFLRVHKKKEAVEALIANFQKEKDPVVKSFYVNSLNELTKAYQGPNPAAWFTWWELAKADKDYELGKTDDVAQKKAEDLGNKLKKRTTVSIAGDVELETEERGGNPNVVSVPILVIPELNRSKEILKPFLSELEKTNKIYYIDLPELSKFKNLPTLSAKNIVIYPIDRLVEAFEDLRKSTGQQRFALISCGYTTWIAMRYAALHPKAVSHLVFISPMSSSKVLGESFDRMEKDGQSKKDNELWHFAMSHTFDPQTGVFKHDKWHEDQKVPPPDGEPAALDRRGWSLQFKDDRDSLISMLYPMKDRRVGGVAFPNDFNCFNQPKHTIPTIVIRGKADPYGTAEDGKQIAKHFGGPVGQYFEYPGSSRMPFAEESELFNKHMAFLLREKSGAKSRAKAKPAEKPKGDGTTEKPAEKAEPKAKEK